MREVLHIVLELLGCERLGVSVVGRNRTRVVDEVGDVRSPLLTELLAGFCAVHLLDCGHDLARVVLDGAGHHLELLSADDAPAHRLDDQQRVLAQCVPQLHAQLHGRQCEVRSGGRPRRHEGGDHQSRQEHDAPSHELTPFGSTVMLLKYAAAPASPSVEMQTCSYVAAGTGTENAVS